MTVTERIDAEFDRDRGFIGLLRSGTFDAAGAERLMAALNDLPLDLQQFDRRLVSLLWYLPLIIGWQEDRVPVQDRSGVRDFQGEVIGRLEQVLGTP